jgi:hypothetical protein
VLAVNGGRYGAVRVDVVPEGAIGAHLHRSQDSTFPADAGYLYAPAWVIGIGRIAPTSVIEVPGWRLITFGIVGDLNVAGADHG